MTYRALFRPEYILGINKSFILNEMNSFLGKCSFKLFFRIIIFVWFYGIYSIMNICCNENVLYEILYESLVSSFLIYLLRIAVLECSLIKSVKLIRTYFLKLVKEIKEDVQIFKQIFIFNFVLSKRKIKYKIEDRAKII